MLKKFSVTNFKGFKDKITLDLSNPSNYEFNSEVINNNCITKAMIYGINGSGKSNFALALFDIIIHLTDKERILDRYRTYINLDSKSRVANFEYVFEFDGEEIVYQYSKLNAYTLLHEKLFISGKVVVEYDFTRNEGYTTLKGAENIRLVPEGQFVLPAGSVPISRVRLIKNNVMLDSEDKTNQIFMKFNDYVDRMLMFYSLDTRGFQGFITGSDTFLGGIIRAKKTKEFEKFLRQNGVDYNLVERDVNGQKELFCHFEKGEVSFMEVASTGTRSLALFYYWYLLMSQTSLVFIDEFDAFYHFELSEALMKLLKTIPNTQVIISTHNTDLLSNEILRPDCYFILNDNKLTSLNKCTEKDLRKAHNLQKMYKAGAFNVQ